ncbi:hypothetical protein TNCV_1334361 [Trichonephila clavipes]|nr:hypothetical protein TNCV_1334361 [Trichonephila clavipes]
MFLGISRVLGELWTAGRYPSADFRPIRKADCVFEKESSPEYIDPVVVYKPRNFWSASHPTEKGDAFPTPGRRQCTHKYIMVWDVLGNFSFWVSYGPREDIPPADFRPIRKADCVSRKSPLQNT